MTDLNQTFYIGVDISKSMLDVCILPDKTSFQCKNNQHGFNALLKRIKKLPNAFVTCEATGGYEKPLAKFLSKHEQSIAVVNPRQIRDFAKALGKLAKTDSIDAFVIALFAEKMQPRINYKRDEAEEKAADLHARRQQLIDMITMEKNRLDKAPKDMKKSILKIIKLLEKELESISKQLQECIQSDEKMAHKEFLLRSVKGIGPAVSAALITGLPELGQLNAKQISALAGVAPLNRDSGKYCGIRTTWGGRASVRCSLFMATIVAIRHNPQIKQFYERLVTAGKKKMVAIVAAMHKLLVIVNAMIKNSEVWRCPVTAEPG